MNGKDLLDKMSDVDPKLIEDAEKKPQNKRRMFIGITSGMAAVAAAAVLAVAVGRDPTATPPVTESGVTSGIGSGNSETTSNPAVPEAKDPPVIDFSEYEHLPVISGEINTSIAKGSESLISKKLSELAPHSPWSSDQEIKTMPVFASSSSEPDLEKMREYVKKAAAALGISESELEITDNSDHLNTQLDMVRESGKKQGLSEDEIEQLVEPYRRTMMSTVSVDGKTDGITLWLSSNYDLTVNFKTPIKLPEDCKLDRNASESEKIAATEYLAEKFKDLLGYEDPVILKDESYPYYYSVYENAGKIDDRIFNYSTKHATFFCLETDPGTMEFMRIYSSENCEKLGDYPIYTAAQAEEILKSNKYSEEDRMPANAKILKTDLVYNNRSGNTVLLPYYEFYVETDEVPDPGDDVVYKCYKICAVPDQFVDVQNVDYSRMTFEK